MKIQANSFQVPNIITDELLGRITKLSSLKCLLIIIRKTRGWHKEQDFISLTQFQKISGMNRTNIVAGLKELKELGLIREKETGRRGAKCYSLHDETSTDLVLVPNQYQYQNSTRTSTESVPMTSTESVPTKYNIKNTTQKTKKEKYKKEKPTVEKPSDVDGQVWEDYLLIRKAKKAPLTSTALKSLEREAEKAGISLEQAITVCCERGWQSFFASWWTPEKIPIGKPQAIRGEEKPKETQKFGNWWERAGFKDKDSAERAGCDPKNVARFKNGRMVYDLSYRPIDEYGRLIDEYGRPIDELGNLI